MVLKSFVNLTAMANSQDYNFTILEIEDHPMHSHSKAIPTGFMVHHLFRIIQGVLRKLTQCFGETLSLWRIQFFDVPLRPVGDNYLVRGRHLELAEYLFESFYPPFFIILAGFGDGILEVF